MITWDGRSKYAHPVRQISLLAHEPQSKYVHVIHRWIAFFTRLLRYFALYLNCTIEKKNGIHFSEKKCF